MLIGVNLFVQVWLASKFYPAYWFFSFFCKKKDMARRKQQQFADNANNPLFFQPHYHELLEGFDLKGNWGKTFFKNDKPIVLELGCGKGEYTVGMARSYPHKNFIGIDVKGARMWRGATDATDLQLPNVAFVRSKIEQLPLLFAAAEVDEIWLTFSDPQPKYEKRRLSSPKFLNLYHKVLKPEHRIHIKTDNAALFEYTLRVIKHFDMPVYHAYKDLYASDYKGDATQIQTFYEQMYLAQGVAIKYAVFSLPEAYKNNTLLRIDKVNPPAQK